MKRHNPNASIILILAIVIGIIFSMNLNSFGADKLLTPDQEHRRAEYQQELDVLEYMNEEINIFIGSVTWDFEGNSNLDRIQAIGGIISKYGWTSKNSGVMCQKRVNEAGEPYLLLIYRIESRVNSQFVYHSDWELYEKGDDEQDI